MKKSIFLFFAAILCAIGMNAATPTKIYLNAQSWGYSDARYAAYFFDPAKWVDMKKVDGETFIYEVDVPAGYTKVIFVRMNGGTTANNWDNKWNQTGDLTIPTNGKNMFKPSGWDGATTTWSTYTYTPPTFYIAGDFVTPNWSENAAANKMDYADGVFSKSYDNVAASPHQFKITNGTWTNAIGYNKNTCSGTNCTVEDGGGNIQFTPLAEGTVTITYTLADGKIHITCPEPPAAEFNITYPATQTNYTLVAGPAKAQTGAEVSFTATPAEGYVLNVTYNGNVIAGENNVYTFMMPAADVTIAITAVAATTLYYVDHNNWGNVNAYMWNDNGNNGSWPGAAMALVGTVGDKAYSYYSISFAQGAYTSIIFNGGGSQTADLTIDPAKPYFYDGEWYTWDDLLAKLAAPVVTYDYYIAGNMNGWNKASADYGMTDEDADGIYEKEITLAAGQDHQFKVTNGKWGNETDGFDCATVEGAYEEVDSKDGNVLVKLNAETTFIVKFDKNAKKISFEGLTEKAPEPTFDYYIAGTFNGNDPKNAENGMTLDGTVYKATVTLAAGDNTLKVTDGTWENTWGYGQLGAAYEEVSDAGEYNNIKITLAAEKEITVIFDASAGKITFEGLTVSTAPTKYYVKGTHNEWTADATSEMTLDGEVYKKEVTLAKDVEFKINDGADAWWGKDNLGGKSYNELEGLEGGNLKMKEAKTFTIIFKPTEHLITFDGLTEKAPAKCYLMGIGGDWTTGIEMEEDGDQFKLLCQPIAEDEQFKFKYGDTWSDGVENHNFPGIKWVDDDEDGNSNITLPAGIYDFYYKKATNQVYIAAVYLRDVTNTWGTICLPHASTSFSGAKFYEVSSLDPTKGLWLDEIEAETQLVAGKPYVFEATASTIKVTYTDKAVAAPVEGVNGLTGTFTDIAAAEDGVLVGNYIIGGNKVHVATAQNDLPANRAYIDAALVPNKVQAKIPGRRRVCMGENATTGLDQIVAPEGQAVKAIVNGQLIIIRDGVKYNVQGQKL